jgi:chemotaxis signal transduction protein
MNPEERDHAVLAERARALARPHRQAQREQRYTLFERCGIQYAIEPQFVFELARVLAATPLPRAAPHWLGVTSLHGELLAVADLSVLLGGSNRERAQRAEGDSDGDEHAEADPRLVLVLGGERRELALLIDAALEATVLSHELSAVPPSDDSGAQLVLGTTREGIRVVAGEALLADPRLFLQAAHQPQES